MANTYTLIASNTLGASAASVTFSSIPSTYTDLVLRVSARSTSTDRVIAIEYNADASSIYSTTLLAVPNNTTPTSANYSNNTFGRNYYQNESANTASTFGSMEIYIPNYTSTTSKPTSTVGFQETNASTTYMGVNAGLYRNTSAISTIKLTSYSAGNFDTNSSFYLYGIKNS